MKTIRNILLVITSVILLGGCNQSDDINEIFVSGAWTLNNYYSKGDWNSSDPGGVPLYTMAEDLKVLYTYTVEFKEDGSVTGNMENITFTGQWSANPDDHSVSITRLKPASSSLSGKSREFIMALENARYYKGTSKILQLAPESKVTFVQFRHIGN